MLKNPKQPWFSNRISIEIPANVGAIINRPRFTRDFRVAYINRLQVVLSEYENTTETANNAIPTQYMVGAIINRPRFTRVFG